MKWRNLVLMRALIGIAAICLLSSCATLLNKHTKYIDIVSTEPVRLVVHNDTIPTVGNTARIEVLRKKHELKIELLKEYSSKTITLKHNNRPIYIVPSDTSVSYLLYDPRSKKNHLYLNFSVPHLNNFHLKPKGEEIKNSTGFFGFAMGLDYYYSKADYLNLRVSTITDFFIPVPAPVDIIGEYDMIHTSTFELSNNHRVRNFLFGYGISYARNTWSLYNHSSDTLSLMEGPIRKHHQAFGLVVPVYYQLGRQFYAGLVYRPGLFRDINGFPFEYEHNISLEIGWKIRLKKQTTI